MNTKIEKSEKTICFSREKFFEYENERQKNGFTIKPQWKSNSPRGSGPGGHADRFPACVCFYVPPSLNPHENPKK